MQLTLEFFLIGKFAASSQYAILRAQVDGVGSNWLTTCRRRRLAAGRARCAET